jgi:hypothetical protein
MFVARTSVTRIISLTMISLTLTVLTSASGARADMTRSAGKYADSSWGSRLGSVSQRTLPNGRTGRPNLGDRDFGGAGLPGNREFGGSGLRGDRDLGGSGLRGDREFGGAVTTRSANS